MATQKIERLNGNSKEKNTLHSLSLKLAKAKKELEEALQQLEIAKAQAHSASQTSTQFLANISHEIRTPLGVILGFSDLLKDPSLSMAERENYLARIRKGGHRLLTLINEILELKRVESGSISVKYNFLGMQKLINDLTLAFAPMAKVRGLNLIFDLPDNLPKNIYTDEAKLKQILHHLISNAIKFSENGVIKVTIKLNLDTRPNEINFTIRDCGAGIPNSYIPNLFKDFSQGDNSMTRPHGGGGLGLSLAQKLAHALNGEVELLSTSAQGSVFCARFPLTAQAKVVPLPQHKPEKSLRLDQVKILLVDDAPDNLVLLRHLLKKTGALIETASDGQEGVEKAMTGKHDLILMDLQMPRMNGYEATSQLRSQGYTGPIVALTAHAMTEDREKCLASGYSDYLAKPIVTNLLMQTIQKNLKNAHLSLAH